MFALFALSSLVAVSEAAHLTRSAAKLWSEAGAAAPSDRAKFTIGLVMRDAGLLKRTLDDISSPASPNYGKWLSAAAADALTATPADVKESVLKWATSTGAACEARPEALACEATVSQLEALTGATFSYYTHKTTGRAVIRTSMASAGAALPAWLEGKVTVITGLVELPMHERAGHVVPQAAAGDYYIVPETLTTFYNVKTNDSAPVSSAGPIEYQDCGSPRPSDIRHFANNTALPEWNVSAVNAIGPMTGPDAGGCYEESTLDEQYIVAMAPNATRWYVTVSAWQYEFLTQISALTNDQLPTVMSISYGWSEQDQCRWSPATPPCDGSTRKNGSAAYVIAVNDLFAKMTARGITFLVSSGDSGAHGRDDEGCVNRHTHPDFPTSSPFVTSVGATAIKDGVTSNSTFRAHICEKRLKCATGGTEVVAGTSQMPNVEYSSGGGFSDVAPQPAWQAAAVAAFLATNGSLVGAPVFNKTGRGYPDIAALGHMFYVELDSQPVGVDGTSASTPVVAGLVASLNAWRVANGKPVLGFLNPLLYSLPPTAFNDITSGDNSCTEEGCSSKCSGFAAVPGWDAATGFGTPNYEGMKAAITALGI